MVWVPFAGLLDHPLLLELLACPLGVRTLLRFLFRHRCTLAFFVGALLRLLVGLLRTALVFLDAAALLGLAGLCGLALALLGVALSLSLALDGGASLLVGAANRVELFLLLAGLLLEHVALDVSALLANLDVDRARAALAAAELDLARRLAVQRDAARGRFASIFAAVRLAQVRQ